MRIEIIYKNGIQIIEGNFLYSKVIKKGEFYKVQYTTHRGNLLESREFDSAEGAYQSIVDTMKRSPNGTYQISLHKEEL